MSTIMASAIDVLKATPLTMADAEAMSVAQLHALRNESEAHRRFTKEWLAAANRAITSGKEKVDPVHLAQVRRADALHCERIRIAMHGFSHIKATKSGALPAASHESSSLREAQDVARRLAAEVERLESELAIAKRATADAGIHRAFYESAQFILATSTFNRIREKAMALLNSVKR